MRGHLDDPARLASLARYGVTGPDHGEGFEGIARLASVVAATPLALVNFLDAEDQHFAACVGVEMLGAPNRVGYCPTVVTLDREIVSSDTTIDPLFCDNPINGEPYHVRAYAGLPVRDPEGRMLGTVCVLDQRVREFTEGQLDALRDLARQAEILLALRLAESGRTTQERRLRRIADLWPEGFALLKPIRDEAGRPLDYEISYVNTAAALQTGGTPQSLVGTLLNESPAGIVVPALRALYDRAAGGESGTEDVEFPSGDVSRYRAEPLDGEIAVSFVDMTDDVRREAELADSERRFRILAEGTSTVVYRTNPGVGSIFTDEARWQEAVGFPSSEWNMEGFQKRVPEEDHAAALDPWLAALKNPAPFMTEHRVRTARGLRWFQNRVAPVMDAKGEVREWIGMYIDIHDRKLLEGSLLQVLDALPNLAWSSRPDGHNDFVNARFADFAGVPKDELLNDGWVGVLHPDDLPRAVQAWGGAVATKSAYEIEYRFRDRATGGYRWFLGRALPLLDSDGTVLRWIGTCTDIHELKLIEGERVRREAELAEIFDAMPQIVWRTRPDGFHDYYNARWYEFTGLSRDASAGEGWANLLHPEDLERTRLAWEHSLRTGEDYEIEYRFQEGATGKYRWFLGRAHAVRDEDGAIRAWHGTLTDIHARRDADDALRLADALVRATRDLDEPLAVIEAAEQAVGDHMRVDRVAYADVEADGEHFRIRADWCGPGVPTTIGEYALSLFGPKALAEMLSGVTFVSRAVSEEIASGEGREMFHAIGVESIICVPLVKEGRLRAMMAVHCSEPRDWSDSEINGMTEAAERTWATIERARAETELRTLAQNLDVRVKERTAALEAANKELEGFTYTVAHDLRTPLRAIVANARFLEEDFGGLLPEEGRKLVRRGADAAKKLGHLMDDLLQLSRLARQTIQREPVDLSELAKEEGGGRTEVQPGLIANGDARLLRLVMRNLLENSRKFTPEGKAIEFGRNEAGEFFVRDQGIGFDMKYAHKLFMPFERLVREDQFPGSGVGLANVKRIVERHGGKIRAESTPGHGATFLFTLG